MVPVLQIIWSVVLRVGVVGRNISRYVGVGVNRPLAEVYMATSFDLLTHTVRIIRNGPSHP